MILLSDNPLAPFLARMISRSALDRAEQEAILNLRGHPVQVQANRDIAAPGDSVDHVSLVVDGLVARFGQNSEGQRQITAVYIAGDLADLASVVVPDSGSALQALTVTTLLKFPHSAVQAVARRYPAIAEAFWRECAIESAMLSEWMVNVGRRDARTRTAHLLCEMACRHQASGASGRFSFGFPVTQIQLADMLALTPVHVNRTLRALRDLGLANVRSRSVEILDWNGLVAVGDFDPTYLQVDAAANNNGVAAMPGAAAPGLGARNARIA